MLIRTASINDLDAVAAVESECFPPDEAATREEFAERLNVYANHFWLLYVILFYQFCEADRQLHLLCLTVNYYLCHSLSSYNLFYSYY